MQLQGCLAGGGLLVPSLLSAEKGGGVPLERVSNVDLLQRGGVFMTLPADAMGRRILLVHPGTLKTGVHLTVQCK